MGRESIPQASPKNHSTKRSTRKIYSVKVRNPFRQQMRAFVNKKHTCLWYETFITQMPPELHFIIPAWGKNASVDAPRSSAPGTGLFVDMFSNVIIISCEDVIIRVCPQACLSSHVCGAHTTTITTMVTTTTTITAAPIPPPPPLPLLSIMVNLVVQVFVMLAPWLFRSRLGN